MSMKCTFLSVIHHPNLLPIRSKRISASPKRKFLQFFPFFCSTFMHSTCLLYCASCCNFFSFCCFSSLVSASSPFSTSAPSLAVEKHSICQTVELKQLGLTWLRISSRFLCLITAAFAVPAAPLAAHFAFPFRNSSSLVNST